MVCPLEMKESNLPVAQGAVHVEALRHGHTRETILLRFAVHNPDTMSASAFALNRFGLGARPYEPAPADPQRWLLSQFDKHEALRAAWQPLPRTQDLVEVWLAERRAIRQAPDGERSGIRAAYLRKGRDE